MIAELQKTVEYWNKISEVVSIPKNESNYKKNVRLLDEILDIVGDNENHKLVSLLEYIAYGIEEYEKSHVKTPQSSPVEVLKYLMDEHNLKQTDMKEMGSQGVVSEILSGKRSLTTKQILRLCNKFNVSADVFIK